MSHVTCEEEKNWTKWWSLPRLVFKEITKMLSPNANGIVLPFKDISL